MQNSYKPILWWGWDFHSLLLTNKVLINRSNWYTDSFLYLWKLLYWHWSTGGPEGQAIWTNSIMWSTKSTRFGTVEEQFFLNPRTLPSLYGSSELETLSTLQRCRNIVAMEWNSNFLKSIETWTESKILDEKADITSQSEHSLMLWMRNLCMAEKL